MDVYFAEARYSQKVSLPISFIRNLPKKIGLFTTIQFMDSIISIKKQLEKNARVVKLFTTEHTRYPGQLLGCNVSKFPGVDAYVYVGDGKFHPKALVMENQKPVYCYNPLNKKNEIITQKEVADIIRKEKGAYLRFLNSKKIGVIISLKHGQNNFRKSLLLRQKYPEKEFYFLVSDSIDFNSLENFNFIESFVNTACPRIGLDDAGVSEKSIINLVKVL